jgi:asparagine synthase (glutamine-hydrolysing)
MTGLIAVFGAHGNDVSLAGLVARHPTHASRRDEWHDQFCAVARLHHGVLDRTLQPVFNDVGSLCLLLDGEILAAPDGQDAAGLSSAARLLRIYEHDESAMANVNGSFAAIVYDRVQRRIVLITDRLCTRPLYYFRCGAGGLVVASHMATLTAHPRCPKQIDRNSVHQVLAYEQVIGRGTIYRGVHRVEPGAIVCFDGRTLATRRYWSMRWSQPFSTQEEAAEELTRRLREAVSRRISGGLRAGLLLSGGFDSRLILAAAERPILCLTQAASRNREVATAERAARLAGVDFHFIQIDPARYGELFDEAVRLTGGIQKSQACHFLTAAEQARDWCDVMLCGWAFNSFYRGMLLPGRTVKIGRYAARRHQLIEIDSDDPYRLIATTQGKMAGRTALARILDERARREHESVLEDAVREGLQGFDSDGSTSYNAWEYLILHDLARDEDYGNILSIRTWMDDRIVALDFDLIDAALRLKPEWRLPPVVYGLMLRSVLSPELAELPHAATGLVPSWMGRRVPFPVAVMKRVLRRVRSWATSASGHPLGTQRSWPNFDAVLRHHLPMSDRLKQVPDSEAIAACEMFDPNGMRSVIEAHLQGRESNTKLMFILLTLDSWLRQFGGEPAFAGGQSMPPRSWGAIKGRALRSASG